MNLLHCLIITIWRRKVEHHQAMYVTLINILDQYPKNKYYMRYGCIGALSHLISFFQLKHWKICLRLLQDDDKDVRNKEARHVIGKMLNCVNYCDGAFCDKHMHI